MKLDVIENNITRTGEFKEQQFGIGDLSVILDILRGRMYSNAIKSLCQEIMSNARDAHREVNKSNIPIEVKLPNDLDPTFYVRDFGPGITPDRMANIFIMYGCSSKRGDNSQTGGFGLGAKTPFAYTDTFTVTSITPEQEFVDNDGNTRTNVMVKREYIAYIDETKIGSMSLVFSKVTDEPQGTKIALVSQKQDFGNFKQWVRHAALYWQTIEGEPLPVIKGTDNWTWNLPKKETEGEGWFLETKLDKYSYSYKKDISAIIDGVQYPINPEHLNIDIGSQEESILNYALRLIFDVGEISITANREEIDYSKKSTVEIIKSRLRLVVADLQEKLSKKIENVSTYWEAKVLWGKYSQDYNSVIKTVFWKGIEIDTENIPIRNICTAFLFSMRSDGYITRKETSIIEFLANTKVCIEDTGLKHPSKCRVQTLFNNTPGLSRVYVVKFSDGDTEKDNTIKILNEKYNFNQIEQINLSTIPRTTIKSINANGSPRGAMTRVFNFTPGYYKRDSWTETDLDIEEDSGIYAEIKNRHAIIGKNTLDPDQLKSLISNLDIKIEDIFGIPTRFLKKVGPDWQKLEDVVLEKIVEIEKDPLLANYFDDDGSGSYTFWNKFSNISGVLSCQNFKDGIRDNTSEMLEYINASVSFNEIKKKVDKLNQIRVPMGMGYFTGNKNCGNLKKLYAIVEKKYPLLKALNTWQAANEPVANFAEYVNLIDAKGNLPEKNEKIV